MFNFLVMKNLIWILAVVLLFICGCETPRGPGDCSSRVSLTVQIKEQPIFYWDPPCDVDGFIVYRHGVSVSGINYLDVVWASDITQVNQISPPLIYAVNPAGIVIKVPAVQLIEGDKYKIKVLRYINEMPGYDFIGETDFIYEP